MSPIAHTVRAAAGGDEAAWNDLVARFTPMLRRVARSYRLEPQDADDVVQNCWLSLYEHVHTLRDHEAIASWLVTTVRRHSFRALQRGVHEQPWADPLWDAHPSPECIESSVLDRERAAVLLDAVRRLPDRQRALLEALLDAQEPSYRDISLQLGIPIGSIGPTRERGLERLRHDARFVEALAA
jgi:RNA polymerase sigma factor (sigma-70 family)